MVVVPATPKALLSRISKALVPVAAPTFKVTALSVPSKVMAPVWLASPSVKVASALLEPILPAMLMAPVLVFRVKDWVLAVVAWMAPKLKAPPTPASA